MTETSAMGTENNSSGLRAQGLRVAIICLTRGGVELARKLMGFLPDMRLYGYEPLDLEFSNLERFSSLRGLIERLWSHHNALVFIMATGIVVRTIAPLIKDKKTDPAVVVLDEKGKFAISLLSEHMGKANRLAKEIADFLGGQAVITTASDVNERPALDLLALERDLYVEDWERLKRLSARIVNGEKIRVFTEGFHYALPDVFIPVEAPEEAQLIITNRIMSFSALYLRPKNLVLGIGCNRGTEAEEIGKVVKDTFGEWGFSPNSIRNVATVDKKKDEAGLLYFAERYGLNIEFFSPEELNRVKGISVSEASMRAIGAQAVAEPAAILASGADTLIVPKQKIGNVTVAVAELSKEKRPARLYIVGTGPGSIEHITPYAQKVIKRSDVIVGYRTYLDLIPELINDKEVISTGMTQEIERCKKAVKHALSGKIVSLISGGDPGIYAMAGPVFEIMRAQKIESLLQATDTKNVSLCMRHLTSDVQVEVIPGISALNACAARLGAPLAHDFACVSLSDRLTSWDLIEKRLEAAAIADFVIVLYNPKSKGRPDHINKAQDILLKYRLPETPVGIVTAAMREDEKISIAKLGNMLDCHIDMQTTVIVGNSLTFIWNNWMITPRGYEKKFGRR